MAQPPKRTARGRPRTITLERIADVGIAMGLPNVTFVGLAAELGVSHMALYKHVPSLKDLKALIAEEIFKRWEMPVILGRKREELKDYLIKFTDSLRNLVKSNPGLPPYLLRRSVATPSMTDKIGQHQKFLAEIYGISDSRAQWLLSTIAFHCIAVADTLYSDIDEVSDLESITDEAEVEAEFSHGMHALIVGALSLSEKE
ncbi:TetR/AcrR family transcriptional regulator [Marinobacterium mangrovicola]|uniref:AcrR family transcriptional regulator n=1 Tax=Marinobacterium mangrovicola TaxID=1476959 RepID=A0A4R1GPE7_9GAMM|nr:TetR/AcrR family transcriptional regulator [Marinobacterium mangrovicola]TCK09281.1 AcrR family transcriptional regulator [Marinobacterium mangrovicola]